MQKIDRLGWADGICFTSYGLRIGIRVNEPEVLARLPDHLPPGWKPASSPVVDRLYSLVRAGATYYSDEYAVFDAQGRIHPFARRLSLRTEVPGRPERYEPEALGGRMGAKPLPVGLVAFSEYKAGARWRPRELSPGQA